MGSVGEQPSQPESSSSAGSRLAALWRQNRRGASSRELSRSKSFEGHRRDAAPLITNLRQQPLLTPPHSGSTDDFLFPPPASRGQQTRADRDAPSYPNFLSERSATELPYPASVSPLFLNDEWMYRATSPIKGPPLRDIKGKQKADDRSGYPFLGQAVSTANKGGTQWRNFMTGPPGASYTSMLPRAPASQPSSSRLMPETPSATPASSSLGKSFAAMQRQGWSTGSPPKSPFAPIPRAQPRAFGLPSAYQHGGNRPREDETRQRALGGVTNAVPSFMRFDKAEPPSAPHGEQTEPRGPPSFLKNDAQGRRLEGGYWNLLHGRYPSTSSHMPESSSTSMTPSGSASIASPLRESRQNSSFTFAERSRQLSRMESSNSSDVTTPASSMRRQLRSGASTSTSFTSIAPYSPARKRSSYGHTSKTSALGSTAGVAPKTRSRSATVPLGHAGDATQSIESPVTRNRGRSSTISDPSKVKEKTRPPLATRRKPSESYSIGSLPSLPDVSFDETAPSSPLPLFSPERLAPDRIEEGASYENPMGHCLSAQKLDSSDGADVHNGEERLARQPMEDVQNGAAASERAANEDHFGDVDEDALQDAHRRYLLLQQLHLEELEAHAPENSGWLEAKNGCESVFRPRPALRNTARSESQLRSRPVAAFERHRRDNSLTSPPSSSIHAQEVLSRRLTPHGSVAHASTDAQQPLFHHRMPPSTPAEERSRRPARLRHYQSTPVIPPRSSSREGVSRYRRNRGQTPALTPNLTSDDDTDGAQTPDIETVLAQGRQLDADRERWRRQYQRGLDLGGSGVRHRKSFLGLEEEPNRVANLHGRTTRRPQVRFSKSSPDLRGKKAEQARQDSHSPTPVTHLCIPRGWRQRNDSTLPSRSAQRSQSTDSLRARFKATARPITSALAGCFEGLQTPEVPSRPMSPWQEVRRADPSATVPQRNNVQSQQPLIEHPYVVSASRNASTAPSKKDDEVGDVPRPNLSRHPVPPIPPQHQIGAAFSSPKPVLQGLREGETLPQRRFATTYHRPTNSEDLRAMLRYAEQPDADGSPYASRQVPSDTDNALGFAAGSPRASYMSPSLSAPERDEIARIRAERRRAIYREPISALARSTDTMASDEQPVAGTRGQQFGDLHSSSDSTARPHDLITPTDGLANPPSTWSLRQRPSRTWRHHPNSSFDEDAVSQYSLQSAAPRETWNADVHSDDAFSSLFFKPPMPSYIGSHGDSRPSDSNEHAGPSMVGRPPRQRSTQVTPLPPSSSRQSSELQYRRSEEEQSPETRQHSRDEPSQSSSNDGSRSVPTIRSVENMIDDLILLSRDAGSDSAAGLLPQDVAPEPPRVSSESAWNESNIEGEGGFHQQHGPQHPSWRNTALSQHHSASAPPRQSPDDERTAAWGGIASRRQGSAQGRQGLPRWL